MNRNQLIEANLKYARGAASRFTFGAARGSAAWQEAYGAACVALCEAADAYDATRGTQLVTFAWPRMRVAIQRLRQCEATRWSFEIASEDHDGPATWGDPEKGLLERERAVVIFDRMARLSPSERERVESALAGEKRGPGGATAERVVETLARKAGLVVSVPKTERLSGAKRSSRWFSKLTAEQRAERNRKRRERKAAAKKAPEGRAA